MTHYSNDPWSVRCDHFRETGKWYQTVALQMCGRENYENHDMWTIIKEAWIDQIGPLPSMGFLVVLEPYNKFAHPIMVRLSDD